MIKKEFIISVLLILLNLSVRVIAEEPDTLRKDSAATLVETTGMKQPAITAVVEKGQSLLYEIWTFELWSINDKTVSVNKLFFALLILILGLISARFIMKLLGRKYLSRTQLKENTIASVEKLGFYIAFFLIFLLSLRIVNIPLGAFAFLGGAVAIGVGFGAQTLINNFISGFIIMAERPISIGDIIEIEGIIGKVQQINARSTQIITGMNTHILVPNSRFLETNITNWTLSDREIRADVSVGVAYGSPVRKVEELLLQAADQQKDIRKRPAPFVRFKDFGDSALIFKIYFYINIKNIIARWRIESDIRFRICELFEETGISIAFPQLDVHLDNIKPAGS